MPVFELEVDADEARAILAGAPGVTVVDDAAHRQFPMPIDVVGQDDTFVGRIRRSHDDSRA
jgi:aspartate-semialdehyde dehydrogenase